MKENNSYLYIIFNEKNMEPVTVFHHCCSYFIEICKEPFNQLRGKKLWKQIIYFVIWV